MITSLQEELKERLEKLEFERDEQRASGGEVTSSNEILVDISDNTGGHTPTNTNSEELGHRISESFTFTFTCQYS